MGGVVDCSAREKVGCGFGQFHSGGAVVESPLF